MMLKFLDTLTTTQKNVGAVGAAAGLYLLGLDFFAVGGLSAYLLLLRK